MFQLSDHQATVWVIAGDFTNMYATSTEHAESPENTPHGFNEAQVLVGPVQWCILAYRSKRLIYLTDLSNEVDSPGQRLVCKAFYPFPGYTTRAKRETTEFRQRRRQFLDLAEAILQLQNSTNLSNASTSKRKFLPEMLSMTFPNVYFFPASCWFFSIPIFHAPSPGKLCRLVCGCTLLSFLSSFSHYHK